MTESDASLSWQSQATLRDWTDTFGLISLHKEIEMSPWSRPFSTDHFLCVLAPWLATPVNLDVISLTPSLSFLWTSVSACFHAVPINVLQVLLSMSVHHIVANSVLPHIGGVLFTVFSHAAVQRICSSTFSLGFLHS